MFSFLSLPKFPPPRRAHLYLVKALPFVSFASLGMLLMPSAQAQGPSGGWTAVPCDASGNILSNPSYNNDGYVMGGTESGKDSTTCPLFHSYDTASTSYNNTPVPSGIGNYGSGGNEALVTNGSDYFWYGQVYGTNTYATLNGTETVDLSGQLVYYFKEVWQGSGAPTTPIPDHIDLRLKTTVSAFAYVDYGSSGQTSGLSAQASASDGDPFNERATASVSTPDASVLSRYVEGSHLVRASVSGGIATVYLNGQTHMEADNTVPYGVLSYPMPSDPSYVQGTVTNGSTQARSNSLVAGSVRQDSREVKISCPTIETSYYKANVDAQHPDGQWSHMPDPVSGAMSGDSVVVYTAGQNAISVNEYGDAFNALCSGFAHPYYTWSFTGSDGTVGAYSQQYLNAESDQYNSLPLNVNFGSDFDGYPKSGTVKVSVRDGSDNATAANTYSVTWHLPYEAYSYLGETGSGKYVEQTLASGVYPSASYDLPATDAEDFDVSAAFDAGEAITAAAGQEEVAGLFKVAASIAKLTNLKFSYNGDKASLGNRNDGTSWSVAQGDNSDAYGGGNVSPSSLASNPAGWQLCKLSWCVVSKWHENSWHTDKYTIHGYDSSGHLLVVHTTDTVDEEPYFVQYQNPDGTPVSGA